MFKNLKALFIIEEEETLKGKTAKKSTPKPEEKAPQQKAKTTKVEPPMTTEPGKVTQKFMDVLLKALEANNLDGFDYLEFKQSLASLKKMPMDEPTRYQSAFAMAQTMGATPDHLVKTAEHYINVLKKEEQKFEKALINQRNVQIKEKDAEIQQLDKTIQAKANEIKKLTQEIEGHQKKIKALQGERSKAAHKVETTKNNFIASFETLVGKIAADVDNMKKYLK